MKIRHYSSTIVADEVSSFITCRSEKPADAEHGEKKDFESSGDGGNSSSPPRPARRFAEAWKPGARPGRPSRKAWAGWFLGYMMSSHQSLAGQRCLTRGARGPAGDHAPRTVWLRTVYPIAHLDSTSANPRTHWHGGTPSCPPPRTTYAFISCPTRVPSPLCSGTKSIRPLRSRFSRLFPDGLRLKDRHSAPFDSCSSR